MSEGSFSEIYLAEAARIATELDPAQIEEIATALAAVRERGGRLFVLGVGGGAGHASHAVNDFRKLCALESYAPTDNVSELTARTNDDGWETSFSDWLETSRLGPEDGLLVFSVGGGSRERNVSMNLVRAIERVRHGHRYVPRSLEEWASDTEGGASAPHDALSDREYQVLRMIGSGHTVSEIAAALHLSVKTISTYRTRLLEKLQMRSNAELMRYAIENRLVDS